MSEIGDKGKENELDDEGSASGDSSEVRDHRFSAPTASSSNTNEAIGKEIGPYKILSVLGEGGCGIVYLAQQGRPIKRRVALKIIKPGMDSKRVIARFEAERQALALLDHPNIARIFDAGLTSEGRPYFVMEHVRGVPITEHCDHHRLNIEQRINLFLLICDAIHYAHQKGIIHRDIKPSNILVGIHGSQSVPKVIDFGVAKAVSQPLTDKTLFTEYGQMIGTPEYMSPEQAEMTHEDIDTRTDIYSLGVIFYELLTGSLPFDTQLLRGHGIDHIRKVILEEDPKTPSTKLRVFSDDERKIIVKGRDTEIRTLSRSIRGDLDWITIKAMEKDRIRRYETVNDLALDLKRHLKNEPVTAGPPSLKYRTGKFLRRHRTAAIMASLFTLTIVFGITMLIKASADNRKAIQVEHLRNKIQWARTEVIPTIMERIEAEDYCKAYDLATDVSKWIPDDQILKGLWSKMSNSDFSLDTVPSNAKIFYREYSDVGGPWHFLGLSPINNTRFPYGCYRLRVQKEGFNATERILLNTTEPMYYRKLSKSIVLHANNDIPNRMVYVPNMLVSGTTLWMMGGGKIQMGHYFIDKNEVTNKEYFEFVRDGGYQNPQFWKHQFVKDGKELSWDQAMAQLHDSTGQPGPKHWKNGRFQVGKDEFPVTGISWYEADAYANYRGKSLPTVYHWIIASMPLFTSSYTIPLSNFRKEGPMPVGTTQGINFYGSYDMAGNVAEWCYNAKDESESERYILGGAWGEPDFSYYMPSSEDSFHRSEQAGFRCIKLLPIEEEAKSWEFLGRVLDLDQRNLHEAKPVSDYDFHLLARGHFSYDHEIPLNVEQIDISDISNDYRKEKITINAAYDGERMDLFILLPKGEDYNPPYLPVIIFPSAGGLSCNSNSQISERVLRPFLVKSGRAVIFPVYKGMYSRAPLPYEWTLKMGTLPLFKWGKDWMRTVDYLKTRNDIDVDKLSFFGYSLGGCIGAYISGPEKQPFKACVLRGGGIALFDTKPPPEYDPVNYLPRIKIPVLMINGQNDALLPLDASQKPMYDLLGTALEDKHHVVIYEGRHVVPREKLEKETLQFLDRYLGKPSRHIPDPSERDKTTRPSE